MDHSMRPRPATYRPVRQERKEPWSPFNKDGWVKVLRAIVYVIAIGSVMPYVVDLFIAVTGIAK